ncbi:universal stress protein [Streptosporangium sp. NPDC049376]|uniref:universal stress protein n=1 Tax=Streptosporangium sp. NPDC049376 TaxID=3366192 RepID=UPI00379D8244
MTEPVVAGVDGSEASLDATAWAATAAALRRAPLRLVHVTLRWAYDVPLVPQPAHWGPASQAACRELLARAAERARAEAPSTEITTEVLDGAAAEAIAAAAGTAQLVVVGGRGRGGFTGLLLGSVSRDLAVRCPCPLVVVRPREEGGGEVVVGATGEPGQEHILRFAFEEALLRRLPLRAVHAWTHPVAAFPGDMQPLVYDVEGVGREEERLLAESLAGWRERFPDVPLVEQVVHGHPAGVLAEASATAELVVVGAPGRVALLGSTVHSLLGHARGPVAVVPRPPGHRPPGTAPPA